MPLEPTAFHKALSASAFKPQEKRQGPTLVGLEGGMGRGGDVPNSPREGLGGIRSRPFTPTPRGRAPGAPSFVSFPLWSRGRGGSHLARCTGSCPALLPQTRRATPISAAYPRGPRGPSSVASPGLINPALHPLPVATSAAGSRLRKSSLAAPHPGCLLPPPTSATSAACSDLR